MSTERENESRFLRALLFALALVLLGTFGAAGLRSCRPEWKVLQARYTAEVSATDEPRQTDEFLTSSGELERCRSCHRGWERSSENPATLPKVFRPHPKKWDSHLQAGVGCSDCHGGTGRALVSAVAHLAPGTLETDPLMVSPHLQASCSRCHVPGSVDGDQHLARGAILFLDLGCAVCHPLRAGGLGGWDFGPDLRATGRRNRVYLEARLIDPTESFPHSTMPSFAGSLGKNRPALADVILYLDSLVLPRASGRLNLRSRSDGWVASPCTTCHGAQGKASGLFRHRCVYLIDRKESLSCGHCHASETQAIANPAASCPVVKAFQSACGACHDPVEGR